MKFDVEGRELEVEPEAVIVAAFTGRDRDGVLEHIEELGRLGVPPPATVPCFYMLPPTALVQTTAIDAVHPETSGEVEIALIFHGAEVYLTLASDHTDRAAESIDMALSKQVCPKVIATSAWREDGVVADWDTLELRSWIGNGRDPVLYQDGVAGSLLSPSELLQKIRFAVKPRTFVLLAGTIPVAGDIRSSSHFRAELFHPRTDRTLSLEYRIDVLDALAPA